MIRLDPILYVIHVLCHLISSSNGGTTHDHVNNVERVDLPNTGGITYIVNISAYKLPMAPQPFSLVVTGNIS